MQHPLSEEGLHRQEPVPELLCSPHPSMLCARSGCTSGEEWAGAATTKYRGLSQSACQLGQTALACAP